MNRRIFGMFIAAMIAESLILCRASAQAQPDIEAAFDSASNAVRISSAKARKEATDKAPEKATGKARKKATDQDSPVTLQADEATGPDAPISRLPPIQVVPEVDGPDFEPLPRPDQTTPEQPTYANPSSDVCTLREVCEPVTKCSYYAFFGHQFCWTESSCHNESECQ